MAEHRAYKPIDARPGGPQEPLLKVLRELDANVPWLHGRRVRVEFDGVSASVDVEHGLGRRYEGGWVMDRDGLPGSLAIITGESAAESGVDISQYMRVVQSSAIAHVAYVWVY